MNLIQTTRAHIMMRRHSLTAKGWLRSASTDGRLRSASTDGRPRGILPIIGIFFVPQQEAYVIERFGKFHEILNPGLHFVNPITKQCKYIQVLKELAIHIPEQNAITKDNVTLTIDGVLYLKVEDPYKASYGVEDAQYAVTQLAQTTMRSELGKKSLDEIFQERETLNVAIVFAINKAAEAWGLNAMRYEILDLKVPKRIEDAMQMQVEAERMKRASILESEGIRASEINRAEGIKQSKILTSEAYQIERINEAEGEAKAVVINAEAQSTAIRKVAEALGERNGHNAVSMKIAESYIKAFENIAKETNTVLLPSSTGDVSSMVSQAMAIYKSMDRKADVKPKEQQNKADLEHKENDIDFIAENDSE